MEDWLMMDAEESSKTSDEEIWWKDFSSILKIMELFDDEIGLVKRKKRKDQEEEEEQYYNVSVYRVLPYPPHTKDVKDFFVQRN